MSAEPETYPMPAEGWTCFHCGMHFGGNFKGWQEALHHFGENVSGDALCQYKAIQVRAMEDLLRDYREEDTQLHRRIAQLQSDHAIALRREEEKGYARGLGDYNALTELAAKACAEMGCYCPGDETGNCVMCRLSEIVSKYAHSAGEK